MKLSYTKVYNCTVWRSLLILIYSIAMGKQVSSIKQMERKDVIVFPHQIKDSCQSKHLNTLASVSQVLLIIVIELAGKYHSTFMFLKEWYFFFHLAGRW